MHQNNKSDIIENKLDKINDKINDIDVTLVEQHIVLKEHIKRTEALERAILPIRHKVAMVEGVIYFLGILATLAAIYEAFRKA